jgi:hypothetical protein
MEGLSIRLTLSVSRMLPSRATTTTIDADSKTGRNGCKHPDGSPYRASEGLNVMFFSGCGGFGYVVNGNVHLPRPYECKATEEGQAKDNEERIERKSTDSGCVRPRPRGLTEAQKQLLTTSLGAKNYH